MPSDLRLPFIVGLQLKSALGLLAVFLHRVEDDAGIAHRLVVVVLTTVKCRFAMDCSAAFLSLASIGITATGRTK